MILILNTNNNTFSYTSYTQNAAKKVDVQLIWKTFIQSKTRIRNATTQVINHKTAITE